MKTWPKQPRALTEENVIARMTETGLGYQASHFALQFGVSNATMATMLDALAERGLIRRMRSLGRKRYYALSAVMPGEDKTPPAPAPGIAATPRESPMLRPPMSDKYVIAMQRLRKLCETNR